MRHKISDEEKKKKFSITIDERLSLMLDKYMKDNNIKNKSTYIESLVRKDMMNKGEKIERKF